MPDPEPECVGEIAKGEAITNECHCFKHYTLTKQVDGSSLSLKFAETSTPGRKYKPFVYNDTQAIANNTKGLKLCGRRLFRPLHGGIKTNCNDVYVKFKAIISQTYPLEFGRDLLIWEIGYRGKFSELMTNPDSTDVEVDFPFSETFTFNQYHLEGGVVTLDPPMNIGLSDLKVNLTLESNCARSINWYEATVTDSAATNDGWSLPAYYWDPSGSTWRSGQVHTPEEPGRIGTVWRFYNTIQRFMDVTYGPQVFVQYLLTYVGDPSGDEPDGFTTLSKALDYPP